MDLPMAGMELLQNDLNFSVLQSNPKQMHPSLGTIMNKNSVSTYHISFPSENYEDLNSIHQNLIF